MKKLKYAIVALVALVGVLSVVPTMTAAASPAGEIQSGVTAVGGAGAPTLGNQITTVINVLLYILGAIAVIMIVVGGIRYVTSGGDSGAVSSAKNTILYSVIGLIVAIMAYAIVNFVITAFHA